jgi:hypothetical protein
MGILLALGAMADAPEAESLHYLINHLIAQCMYCFSMPQLKMT